MGSFLSLCNASDLFVAVTPSPLTPSPGPLSILDSSTSKSTQSLSPLLQSAARHPFGLCYARLHSCSLCSSLPQAILRLRFAQAARMARVDPWLCPRMALSPYRCRTASICARPALQHGRVIWCRSAQGQQPARPVPAVYNLVPSRQHVICLQ